MSREPLTVRELKVTRQIPSRRELCDVIALLPLTIATALFALASRIIDTI